MKRFGMTLLGIVLMAITPAIAGDDASGDKQKKDPCTPRTQPVKYTIPIIDLTGEPERLSVVDSRPNQYCGHPHTLLLEDKRTILCVYPLGHGGAVGGNEEEH